jgi:hypothetical protein
MVHDFEIIQVINIQDRGQFILARQIETGRDFEVKEGSFLGGVPIYRYLDMPRVLDQNNSTRVDVFVFKPLHTIAINYFQEGELVELVVPEL